MVGKPDRWKIYLAIKPNLCHQLIGMKNEPCIWRVITTKLWLTDETNEIIQDDLGEIRNKMIQIKSSTGWWKHIFLNIYIYTYLNMFFDIPSPKWASWRGKDMLIIVDYMYSLLKNPLGNGYWSTAERRGVMGTVLQKAPFWTKVSEAEQEKII